jgi:hypothetical protein
MSIGNFANDPVSGRAPLRTVIAIGHYGNQAYNKKDIFRKHDIFWAKVLKGIKKESP